ncbi:MAG: DUF3800 domain-containing protein [Proteobacteria bacterium]|nr:DUF3800 domain-containing protein [Pseudomonadota bacterium]
MIDVNQLREPEILMHGLSNADEVYILYYDESNNFRRLILRPSGLNNPDLRCFVLGGIGHKRMSYDFRFDALRAAVQLQKSAKEMKLEHLGKGGFLEVLDSPKVSALLQWLLTEQLFIHYVVLDPLYWSIVDIIDSVLSDEANAYLQHAGLELKNDLYTVLRNDSAHLLAFLYRYSYPNIGRTDKEAFVRELLDMLEERSELLAEFNFQMLKGTLQIAVKQQALPYLEDEKPNVLVDELSSFFIHRICLLKNSNHIFDDEPWIEALLKKQEFRDGDQPLDNFRFAKSHDEPGIQISDVIVGLLGKYFTFLTLTDKEGIVAARQTLSNVQLNNLRALNALIDTSIAENQIFVHSLLSLDDHHKNEYFLQA